MREFLDAYRPYDPELVSSFRGATESAVDGFEHALGVELPRDYRDFLLTMAGGSDHPESHYLDDSVVLLRVGRHYISFALDAIADQRTAKHRWNRNTRRDWIRIGAEDGCTSCDPYLYADGRVVQATFDRSFEAPWFASFRDMLFALGFYWLARPGDEVTFLVVAEPGGKREPKVGPGFEEFAGAEWERAALCQIAADEGLPACTDVPAPSLAFRNATTTILFSTSFRTPIGSPHPELRVTSTDSAVLARVVPRIETALLARALRWPR